MQPQPSHSTHRCPFPGPTGWMALIHHFHGTAALSVFGSAWERSAGQSDCLCVHLRSSGCRRTQDSVWEAKGCPPRAFQPGSRLSQAVQCLHSSCPQHTKLMSEPHWLRKPYCLQLAAYPGAERPVAGRTIGSQQIGVSCLQEGALAAHMTLIQPASPGVPEPLVLCQEMGPLPG